MKKFALYFIAIVLFAGIIGGAFYYKKYVTTNKEVISYSDELYLIVEENEIEREEAVIFYNDILYFSFPVVKDYIDPNIYFDEEEEILIITSKERVLRYKVDEDKASVNSKEFFIDNEIKKIDDKIYIPIDILMKYYEVDISYYDNTKAVVLDYSNIYYLPGEIIMEGAVIRTDLSIKSPIINNNLPLGSIVYIYAEYESWYKVRTMDGIPGFIEKKYLKINYSKDLFKVEIPKKDIFKKKDLINLTWDYTYRTVTNTDNIRVLPGVNVISPTWFSIMDKDGDILDKGSKEYVKKYNDLGYEIWALVDNDFNPELTHEILSKSSLRENLINSLLKIYIDYGFQGINLDFENVHLKTKDYLTQFVRELYPVFREAGITVSMDVTGMSTSENWSLFYDRKRLSETVDYMILMAYDQHWASSPVPGSVAQYTWVEKSILGVLEYIPNNKLILGVPFYTRLWLEKEGKTSSKAISMDTANKFINENNVKLIWDEKSLQYYGEVEREDTLYKIWLENAKSLEMKASLIHKYSLAGIASWRKGFETEDIWDSLDRALN